MDFQNGTETGWLEERLKKERSMAPDSVSMKTTPQEEPPIISMKTPEVQAPVEQPKSATQNAVKKSTEATVFSGGDPWAAGAGFLLGYMQGKQQEFEQKKAAQMQAAQQMTQGQEAALTNLMNAYRSAYL